MKCSFRVENYTDDQHYAVFLKQSANPLVWINITVGEILGISSLGITLRQPEKKLMKSLIFDSEHNFLFPLDAGEAVMMRWSSNCLLFSYVKNYVS